jgi:hypothetical protein
MGLYKDEFYWLVFWFCTLFNVISGQDIRINEVMFDLEGSDYHDEFVELINVSDHPVSLQGWLLGDQNEQDELWPMPNDSLLTLSPGAFALILDGSYMENSSRYDSLLDGRILVLQIDDGSFGSSGFSNSVAETVILRDSDGETVDVYTYSLDNAPDFSDEKVFPEGLNIADNWRNSIVSGGTPGRQNSVFNPIGGISIGQLTADAHSFTAEIINNTSASVQSRLIVWSDADYDGVLDHDEEVFLMATLALSPYEQQSHSAKIASSRRGNQQIVAGVFTPHLSVSAKTLVYQTAGPLEKIRLNEIMFAPESGDWEWIEIVNRDNTHHLLQGYFLVFDNDTIAIQSTTSIADNSRMVLSEKGGLPPQFGLIYAPVVEVDHWQNLKIDSQYVALLSPDQMLITDLHYYIDMFSESHENRSIEHINDKTGRQDWAFSRAPQKATPGGRNSWEQTAGQTINNFVTLSNRVISNRSGSDKIIITIKGTDNGIVKGKVFNLRGHLLTAIAPRRIIANAFIEWPGTTTDGKKLPSGLYILWLEYSGSPQSWQFKIPVAIGH